MNRTIRRLLYYAEPYRKYLYLTVLTSLIGVSLSLLVPVFIGKAVDLAVPGYIPNSVGKPTNLPMLEILCVVVELCAVVAVSALFQWLQGLCINRLAFGTVKALRTELEAKLQKMPISYIDGSARGDLIARVVPDIEIVSDGLLQGFAQLFSGLVTVAGTLAFMLTINIKIALLVVVLTPLSLIVATQITKASHNAFVWQSELRGELGGLTEELVGGMNVVKAFAYADRAVARFEEINRKLGSAGQKATFFSSMSNPSTRFVNGLIYAAVGTFGALGAIGAMPWIGGMTVGSLASFLAYSNQYTKPFNEISGVIAELQNAVSCAQRVFEVLDAMPEPEEDCAPSGEVRGEIAFEDVNFSYTKDKPLIRGFSMKAKPGLRIAIVGPTGCGKSTIINLLLRFYEIGSGRITIDGVSTCDMTRDDLRRHFGMVLQETWIFTGTVAENIAYGKPDATREEIEQAARAAHAHSFIKRLPDGYDTVISDTSGLSQGQKQLLCIARIMLTDPPMLILDEATSSIDLRTEQRIQRAFAKLMEGKTSFIIAHRLSTIRSADLILVMKDGNIIEQGTHDQLLRRGGFYANLYQSQAV